MSHTPGPLTVKVSDKWPFDIETFGADGLIKFVTRMPCHSSSDKRAKDAIECKHFKQSERKEYSAINRRAIADDVLRAAAPELLEALKNMIRQFGYGVVHVNGLVHDEHEAIREAQDAIAKATGDV